jgi:hypothetical protein
MRIIAKRDFINPGRMLEIENAQHPDHVHMGAVFEVGSKPRNQLKRDEALLVSQLAIADCISDPDDPVVVKQIRDAVAQRERAQQSLAAIEKQARSLQK